MLDRLPADLLKRVIDATSHSIWMRKAILDRLGLVSTSYRRAIAIISDEIVCVDRMSAISILKSWPATRRRQVTTLLVGSFDPDATVSLPGATHAHGALQVLAALPNVEHIYLRNIDLGPDKSDWKSIVLTGSWPPRTFDFCLTADNLFQKCLTLSLREMRVKYFNSIDRRQSLPACTKAFLDSLSAIQIDFSPNLEYHVEEGGAFLQTNTPILFAMDPPSSASFAGLIAERLQYLEIRTSQILTLDTTRLPEIKHIFCTIGGDKASQSDEYAALQAKRHKLDEHLAAAAVDFASPVHVTHDCSATYEFVQPAFLQHLGIGDNNA